MKQISAIIRHGFMAALVMAGTCGIATRVSSAPAAGETYKAKCGMCHGPDGSGNTPMGKRFQIKDLRSAAVQKQSDADLTAIITNGKPPMPAYGKTLTASDIQGLVAYIRTLGKS